MLANLSKIYFRHGPVEDEMGREGREEEGGKDDSQDTMNGWFPTAIN